MLGKCRMGWGRKLQPEVANRELDAEALVKSRTEKKGRQDHQKKTTPRGGKKRLTENGNLKNTVAVTAPKDHAKKPVHRREKGMSGEWGQKATQSIRKRHLPQCRGRGGK